MLNSTPVISKWLPIVTVSEANCAENWRIKSKRHKEQRRALRLLMPKAGYPLPCRIVCVRCGGRVLDSDNLDFCFKWIRDELSDIILGNRYAVRKPSDLTVKRLYGRNDDDARLEWQYSQEEALNKGIRIDVFSR